LVAAAALRLRGFFLVAAGAFGSGGGAAFAAGRRGVTREEADAWLAEFDTLGRRGAYFFSLNRYLFVAERVT